MTGTEGSFALSGLAYFLVILGYAVGGLFSVLVATLRLGGSRRAHAVLLAVGLLSLGYAGYLFFGVADQRVWIFPYAAIVPFVVVAWTVRERPTAAAAPDEPDPADAGHAQDGAGS